MLQLLNGWHSYSMVVKATPELVELLYGWYSYSMVVTDTPLLVQLLYGWYCYSRGREIIILLDVVQHSLTSVLFMFTFASSHDANSA